MQPFRCRATRRGTQHSAESLVQSNASSPNSRQLQTFIKQQNIRIGSHTQGTFLEFDPEQTSRIKRQHAHRVRQGDSQRHDVSQSTANVTVLPASTPSALAHTPPLTVTPTPSTVYIPCF